MTKVSPTSLTTFDLFKDLSARERSRIAKSMVQTSYTAGQYIISSSSSGSDIYFIISGKVSASALSTQGKPVHFEDLKPGAMFGELSAIDPSHRSSDCIASTDAEVAKLSAADFHRYMDEFPAVRNAVLVRLTRMVRYHMQRVFEFSTNKVEMRVRLELQRIAAAHAGNKTKNIVITEYPTHAGIASRISSHREAVTRELNKLQKAGIITWNRDTHIIHDLDKLGELISN